MLYTVFCRSATGILQRTEHRVIKAPEEVPRDYPFAEILTGWPERRVFWTKAIGECIGIAPVRDERSDSDLLDYLETSAGITRQQIRDAMDADPAKRDTPELDGILRECFSVRRYAVVSVDTGSIVWAGFAQGPIEACDAADRIVHGERGRDAEGAFAPASEREARFGRHEGNGYAVHEVPPDFDFEDGASQRVLDLVSMQPRVGLYTWLPVQSRTQGQPS